MENSNAKPFQPEPRKPTRFLGCFGLSSRKKPAAVLEKSRSVKMKKKLFISWPAKKSATKTVPVDSTNNTLSDQKVASDGKSTLKKKRRCRAGDEKVSSDGKVPVDKKVASGDQEPKHGTQEITSEPEEKIITENRDSMIKDEIKSPKGSNNTLQKQFCRKIDAIRAGQSQPGSPDIKPKSNRPSPVSKTTSTPIVNNQKLVGNKSSNKVKKTQNENQEPNGKKYDPVVGMSIIMVTLLIMLFWGRFCAILCTSAWFYFIPRFRAGPNQNVNSIPGSISGEPDFDSEEYKKRVVLEGFLERNHRSVM